MLRRLEFVSAMCNACELFYNLILMRICVFLLSLWCVALSVVASCDSAQCDEKSVGGRFCRV